MRIVFFKDVLHMKSPAGNHPDVWLPVLGHITAMQQVTDA